MHVETFKARVMNGRIVLDEPTTLPEGTVHDLEIVDVRLPDSDDEMETTDFLELLRSQVRGSNVEIPDATVSQFDIWVGDNNPDPKLEYGKGFWDYVEMLRRMIDKFDANDARVIGTYVVRTPPPEEELPMPAVAFSVRGVTFAVKFDFGALADWPYEWTVSVVRRSAYLGPTFGLFEPELDLSARAPISGFPPELALGSFRKDPASFTCRLVDEWDVAALIRLVSHEA